MSGRSKEKARRGKATAARPPGAPVSRAGETPGVEGSLLLESESQPAGLKDRWTVLAVCVFLAAITFAVFGQTLRHEFVNLDDDQYVSENPVVQKGLTWE